MGNERLSKGSIMMASRGVMRKQSPLSTATLTPPPLLIIYMVIRCSPNRLLCFIYFVHFFFVSCAVYYQQLRLRGLAAQLVRLWDFSDLQISLKFPVLLLLFFPPPDKLHSFFFSLSTSPPLCSLPVSILPPTSLHFSFPWRSPGNLFQTEHKGMEQRSGHTNDVCIYSGCLKAAILLPPPVTVLTTSRHPSISWALPPPHFFSLTILTTDSLHLPALSYGPKPKSH